NPLESEGVYPLPEAQRDRFLVKVDVPYRAGNEEFEILRRMSVDPPTSQPVLNSLLILQSQLLAPPTSQQFLSTKWIRQFLDQAEDVLVHNLVAKSIVRLVLATRTPAEF